MYTPLIGDEKRDIVEYTSFGFMNCAHTMLTYTRAMDSALCVPLMIDAAVFCDYFARRGTSQDRVSRALAYLFKVPEGGAQGVDPGFFKQMRALEEELEATQADEGARIGAREMKSVPKQAGLGVDEGVASMLTGGVVCAGISCLDLQLCGSGEGEGGVETIREFEETKYCPGGSCPQTSTALAELGVPRVVALTKMGFDAHGDEMIRQAGCKKDEIPPTKQEKNCKSGNDRGSFCEMTSHVSVEQVLDTATVTAMLCHMFSRMQHVFQGLDIGVMASMFLSRCMDLPMIRHTIRDVEAQRMAKPTYGRPRPYEGSPADTERLPELTSKHDSTAFARQQMEAAGVDCAHVIREAGVQTALAVLPIFSSGARGCFVNLAANDDLRREEVIAGLQDVTNVEGGLFAAVHYGYPHFTKQVRHVRLIKVTPAIFKCCCISFCCYGESK